jgi:enoyl-CoA hydratase
MNDMTDKMLFRKEGHVGTVIFNNPERHNAVSLEMWEAAADMLTACTNDAEIRVVVLTGAGGKAFVSGADISKFGSERATKEGVSAYNAATERLYAALNDFPKPTIAMIRGYCIGGGLGLAAACDLRVATVNSRFAVPAAKLGLGYDYPGLKRLSDIVGPSFTKEIFYTARQFDAEEARQMGFVNRVVSDSELETYVKSYTDMISANAPMTIGAVKFTVGELLKDESKRDIGRCAEMVRACFASRDYVEGRTAFMEKRKPVFTGS